MNSPQPSAPELLGPKEIRELAAKLGVTPTKKLGQNFLHDPNTVRMIVAAAELKRDDVVLEVGPGLGSLTLGLLDAAERVIAVEIDPRLAAELPQTAQWRAPEHAQSLSVIDADALSFKATQAPCLPTALVANLPYNVAVPVLLHMLAEFPSLRRVLVMVQAEVADRLAATPGSKVFGVPSVKAAYYGSVRQAGSIGRKVFWPSPNIDSGLVRIDCYDDPERVWGMSPTDVFPIVDAAFAQRRKTLRAALSGVFGSAAQSEQILAAAGISPQQRGEKLGVEDFVAIATAAREKGTTYRGARNHAG